MRPPKLRSGGGAEAWFWVASVTRRSGFEVAPKGLVWGMPPRRVTAVVWRLAGEHRKAGLVREGGRQGDPDAGDHFGDAPGDLDQAEADRVELCVAPERCRGCQSAQVQQQPVGGGVDQQAELVGGGLAARGAV